MFARSQGLVCRPNARLFTCMYRPTITNIAGQRLRCKRALIYRLGDTKRLVSSESRHARTSPDGSSCIRQIKAEEVHEVWQLDAQSYPDYPTQPIEILTRAQRAAPDLFWGHFANGRMTGFACATLSSGSKWTHDSLFNHEPEGAVACLQSLCVYPEFRKMNPRSGMIWSTEYRPRPRIQSERRPTCQSLLN
ncbi:uncharacterized protein LOC119724655 isoform X2 [Patiria miniata]|uniref:Uncharacterized protein n=1 Tax=Patiria miniata TaxID=46514 RepID=A0A913ZIW3_PATMI|nr:uncharacterized protein LOC119724655 isoform X2 [Patiria miniata]